MRLIVLSLMLVGLNVSASESRKVTPEDQAFAGHMMACAFKNTYYALGPGDASLSENYHLKYATYMAAASRATSPEFVLAQIKTVKAQSQVAVISEMSSAKSAEEIVAFWSAMRDSCDQQISDFNAAGK